MRCVRDPTNRLDARLLLFLSNDVVHECRGEVWLSSPCSACPRHSSGIFPLIFWRRTWQLSAGFILRWPAFFCSALWTQLSHHTAMFWTWRPCVQAHHACVSISLRRRAHSNRLQWAYSAPVQQKWTFGFEGGLTTMTMMTFIAVCRISACPSSPLPSPQTR